MSNKSDLVRRFQKYLLNPITKPFAGYVPGSALLETTGRKTGLPRQTPVGNGLKGDTFWIVAEHGRIADYVRNIQSNPKIRVRVGGKWRRGTAHILTDDDPVERQKQVGLPRLNSALVRLVGSDLMTIRIDLDPS